MYKIILLLSGFFGFQLHAAATTSTAAVAPKTDYLKLATMQLAGMKKLLSEAEQKTLGTWISEYWEKLDGLKIEPRILGVAKKDGTPSVALQDGTVFRLKSGGVEVTDMTEIDDTLLVALYDDTRMLSVTQSTAVSRARTELLGRKG